MAASTERSDGRLRALCETMRAFAAATTDYPRLLDVVCQQMARLIGDGCSLALLSEDGKSLSVSELKPGMAGTATITTKTTVVPVTVTEVKNGVVMQNMGSSILVKTDGGMKMFSQGDMDKRGVKIMKDGKAVDISELRANDQLTATIVTSKPPRILTEKQVQASLAKSAGGGGAPAAAAAAPAHSTAAAPTATSGAEPRKLPKTASPLPLLGLVGLASLIAGLGLTVTRRRASL